MHRTHLVILALAGAALAACTQPKTTAVTKAETSNDSNQGASCPTSHADAGVPVDCSSERANRTTPLGGL